MKREKAEALSAKWPGRRQPISQPTGSCQPASYSLQLHSLTPVFSPSLSFARWPLAFRTRRALVPLRRRRPSPSPPSIPSGERAASPSPSVGASLACAGGSSAGFARRMHFSLRDWVLWGVHVHVHPLLDMVLLLFLFSFRRKS